jgi:hypothetical protein
VLRGRDFLNDRIISFFFEYLVQEEFQNLRGHVLLIPPDVAMMLRFASPDDITCLLGSLKAEACDMVRQFGLTLLQDQKASIHIFAASHTHP